jgi:hypothetical protein
MEHEAMGYWDLVPASVLYRRPPRTAAHDLLDLGWWGMNAVAPNIASLAAGEAPPPLPSLPATPGKIPTTDDPRIAGAMGEAANIGMTLMPMPGAGVAAGGSRWLPGLMRRMQAGDMPIAESLASRSASLYNPPVKPQLPIGAQYPHGVHADAIGRLTHDNKGRELVAQYIVGRRTVGGADEALSPAEYDAVAEAILGSRHQVVAASALPRGAVGAYDPNTGRTAVYRGLSAETKDMVAAHELAHGLNDKAGDFVGLRRANSIPIKPGMPRELKTVYNDLNNPYLAAERSRNPDVDPAEVYWGTGVTPEKTFGYGKADALAEYMAEAIRAAVTNPNYMKTVAPNTYAAIADATNSHPILSKIIQFNALAALLAGGIDPASLPVPKQSAPPLSR